MWQFQNLLVELKKIITNMHFHLSNEFYCIKSATKRHENMMHNYLHDKQIAMGMRENKTLMVTKIIQRYLSHQ